MSAASLRTAVRRFSSISQPNQRGCSASIPPLQTSIMESARQGWEDQTYYAESSLRQVLNETDVHDWLEQQSTNNEEFRLAYSRLRMQPFCATQTCAQLIRSKFLKILAILIVIGGGDFILQFCQMNDEHLTDERLPIGGIHLEKLMPQQRGAFPVKVFMQHQHMFIPLDCKRLRGNDGGAQSTSLTDKCVLPFTKFGTERRTGFYGTIYPVVIDKEYDFVGDARQDRYALKETDFINESDEPFALDFLRKKTNNIVPLIAYFMLKQKNKLYLVFPWIPMNLEDHMEREPHPNNLHETYDVLRRAAAITSCLSALHYPRDTDPNRITRSFGGEVAVTGLHRDLSPQNILVHLGVFMVSDFGLARVQEQIAGTTGSGLPWSGPRYGMYTAPECGDESNAGKPADVWALGCILLEVITYVLRGYENGVCAFRKAREISYCRDGGFKSTEACFYDKKGLKAVVTEHIDNLRDQVNDDVIRRYLEIIESMLRRDENDILGKGPRIDVVQQQFEFLFKSQTETKSATNQVLSESPQPNSRIPRGAGDVIDPSLSPRKTAYEGRRLSTEGGRSMATGNIARSPHIAGLNTSAHNIRNLTLDSSSSGLGIGFQTPAGLSPERKAILENDEFNELEDYETRILIDDSKWMKDGWAETRRTLEWLAYFPLTYNKGESILQFSCSTSSITTTKGTANVQNMLNTFDRVPKPSRPIGPHRAIDNIVSDYLYKFQEARRPRDGRTFLTPKGLNLIVITNGECLVQRTANSNNLRRTIADLTNAISQAHLPQRSVGIQFARISSCTKKGAQELDFLDQKLREQHGLDRDIVDTKPFSLHQHDDPGAVQAVMLGAFNPHVDGLGEPAET